MNSVAREELTLEENEGKEFDGKNTNVKEKLLHSGWGWLGRSLSPLLGEEELNEGLVEI